MTFSINYKNEPVWIATQSWQLDTCLPGKALELWDLSVLLFVFYDHSRSFRDGQPHPTCPFITNASRVHRAIVNAAIQTVGRTKNIFNEVVLFLVRNYQCRWQHLQLLEVRVAFVRNGHVGWDCSSLTGRKN